MKVALKTLGCRMNQFDTDLIRSEFANRGYEVVPFEDVADIYIVNTCTVTCGGDRSSRQAIYQAKRKNPRAVVVATGCYAQVKPQELLSLKEVDLVVGNTHKAEILKVVEEFLEKREKKAVVGEIFRENTLKAFDIVTFFEESRPFLKVQEGCNKFCTFCVIPFARGKVRSADPDKVVEQVRILADQGFEEIVLSGTQLSQYGWDIGISLGDLIERILRVEGIKLVRLSSLHIGEIDKKTFEMMISEERIAPHFHLSLQSGSDRILELMNRGYTVKDYAQTVEEILKARPISAIGTDIIVGFPSETEEDFRETLKLVEDLPFAYLHVFPYSDRPFTKASKMGNKVPEKVKKERLKRLLQLGEEKRKEFIVKNHGKVLRSTVLSDGRVLTENYIYLKKSLPERAGRVVKVKVSLDDAEL